MSDPKPAEIVGLMMGGPIRVCQAKMGEHGVEVVCTGGRGFIVRPPEPGQSVIVLGQHTHVLAIDPDGVPTLDGSRPPPCRHGVHGECERCARVLAEIRRIQDLAMSVDDDIPHA